VRTAVASSLHFTSPGTQRSTGPVSSLLVAGDEVEIDVCVADEVSPLVSVDCVPPLQAARARARAARRVAGAR